MLGSLFKLIFKIAVGLCALILFGYAEKQMDNSGLAVSVLLTVYLLRRGGWHVLLGPLCLVGQVMVLLYEQDIKDGLEYYLSPHLASIFSKKTMFNGLFILMLFQYVAYTTHVEADDLVYVRPYEREIRSILLEHDHSKLHTVDMMLEQNKGHERLVLLALKKEYGIIGDDDDYDGDGIDGMGGDGGGGRNGNETAPWENVSKLFQQDIIAFVEQHDPTLKRHLPRMLRDYTGREEQLLKTLHREYDVGYVIPSYARKYGQAPITVDHGGEDDAVGSGSRSPFRTKDETMLEMARREAREEIQNKLDNYGRRR